jgi:hypothetical protein
MANWKEYTTKTTPEDADEIMIADTKANANKRTPFGGLWNWIAGKLATAVISQLETQSKSIIPALNELNSKTLPTRLTDAFQDTLQTGISIATYVTQTANAPSEYGIILYLAHNKDSNKWYIAIAFGTATNEAFISRKINSGPWSNWEKISVTK